MSLLEALQLIGYSLGAVLTLWLGYLLYKERLGIVPIQRLLLSLGLCMVGWHAGNLIITLRSLFGGDLSRWHLALRLANTVAVISITFCYSLLLHVHIYLWAAARARSLSKTERLRIYLSYIPCLFLFVAIPRIWSGPYLPMIQKLSPFVLPFALWAVYSLAIVATTELLVARGSSASERRILQTLAISFLGIALLLLGSLGLGLGHGTVAGQYLQTIANLGSLLPSTLLVYYIYRYRFLELIIKESLIVATFAALVLAVYLYGIRRFSDWANARYGIRAGVLEGILILTLTLLAAPLRGWLERSYRGLFERETSLYRDIVANVTAQTGRYRKLPELLSYIEGQTARSLSLRRVRITLAPRSEDELALLSATGDELQLTATLLQRADLGTEKVFEDESVRECGYRIAYLLSLEEKQMGLLLVDASEAALTPDVRAVLEVLAGQIAVAIADYRLVEENLRLERKVAEGERLAALGQMAATVAHEVKNPLSAIKSIAQVMSEDETLKERQTHDLGLIVGETDRLSKSVTQLLSFASRQPPASAPCRAEDLIGSVYDLFRRDAEEQNLNLKVGAGVSAELDGVQSGAVRDALSNLVLNALQATPPGGTIRIESAISKSELIFSVVDEGPGISVDVQKKIWEPFFTTRQRGTGLGLAIVRKRMEEAGGSARLARSDNGEGARFELRLPVNRVVMP